ncbi:MAG: TIGR02646 family protein [Desulfobacteraceae bacterium]|nr:TIGR02646 family protein [Desulfobacteraceae bacterium]
MKYIKKNEEPKKFADWKKQENPTTWKYLRYSVKSTVRDSLIDEQGHICCYCGTKIQKDNTRIEHLKPREFYKQDIFNYSNLLASCYGSSKDIYIDIKENDTLEKIANQHSVPKEEIEFLNPNIDFNVSNLPKKIKISKIADCRPEDLHCDPRKDNNEIPINPLMPDCEDYFQYRSADGEMVSTGSQEAEDTISILGLNAKLCKDSRKSRLDGIIKEVNNIMLNEKPTKEIFRFKIEKLINRYKQRNDESQFQPYCFVFISYLQSFLKKANNSKR